MMNFGRIAFVIDRRTPDFDVVYPPTVREQLAEISGVDAVPVLEAKDLAENVDRLAPVETLFSTWNMPTLSGEEIDRYFPKLKQVFYAAGSVKYFAPPYLERGVKLYSASSLNARPVAEFTFAQIVLASKGYYRGRVVPSWNPFGPRRRTAQFPGNYGIKVGILGAGHIGQMVASMLRDTIDCETRVYDPYVSESECERLGAKKSSLQEIFAECAVISNHMPDIPETRGILDEKLFSLMAPTTTFINTGRGAQVVERELAAVLRRNPLQTALLDVTTDGTVRPWNPLLWTTNAYITPHIAGSTGLEQGRLGLAMLDAYRSVSEGNPSEFEVLANQIQKRA